MPRFAIATTFLPHKEATWRATAAEISTRHATEHRAYLLDRGIFKERLWMQTGVDSPPLSLTLWDCDDIDRVFTANKAAGTPYEDWLGEVILRDIHGLDPQTYTMPTSELLSGTTTKATATAGTQTMFALPIPEEGVDAVRTLVSRIESGDLSGAHSQFLTESSIREEWIWLQRAQPTTPPLLLVHWIGDDLDHAWQRLTYVRDDEYARVLHEALFTRLVGIAPEQVADWSIEPLLAMHVRRSDRIDTTRNRMAKRLFGAATSGRWTLVSRMLADDVVLTDTNGRSLKGRDDVVGALKAVVAPSGSPVSVDDLLIGENHVVGLVVDGDGLTRPIMMTGQPGQVSTVRLMVPYTA